jgi:pyrimidine-nucleoside phosphorylase
LTQDEIDSALTKTNACVLSHDEIMCPADKILYDLREISGLENDINLLAASIAAKKLASGAKVVLVDIKFGDASIVKTYEDAKILADILKYVFNKNKVESIMVITNTLQTIGEGVGNAVEVVDALNVLQGKHCLLRDISIEYATRMIMKADKKLKRQEVEDMVAMSLDNGSAYNRFLQIIKAQGGDYKTVKEAKMFVPYKSVNFIADKEGYVGSINALMLGELIRRLCAETHDSNIGIVLRAKIGDYVKPGDVIVSFYYKDEADFEKYKSAIAGCVRVTQAKMLPVKVIQKVID